MRFSTVGSLVIFANLSFVLCAPATSTPPPPPAPAPYKFFCSPDESSTGQFELICCPRPQRDQKPTWSDYNCAPTDEQKLIVEMYTALSVAPICTAGKELVGDMCKYKA